MTYTPPNNILTILNSIEFQEPLALGDPRYVNTQEARGSQKTLKRLALKFGLMLTDGQFFPPSQKHSLFFGHRGSGKSTELHHYARELGKPGRFFVVEVDIPKQLDCNNLQFADVLMVLARSLLAELKELTLNLPQDALVELENWFAERVLNTEEAKEFTLEVKTTVAAKGGIPYLLELLAKFTSAFKSNVTYKDNLRRVIRNSFTQFAVVFNKLLETVEQRLQEEGLAQRVLFIVDGTDKMSKADTGRFFVEDAELLLAIDTLVIYTAPLTLKYEGNLTQSLDADLMLPMIKLYDAEGKPHESGGQAMRDILLKRADESIFTNKDDISRLVEHSGGHPRDLLRLLKLCCEFAEDKQIDTESVDQAIRQLASEYRCFLEPDDYKLLAEIDRNPVNIGNDERTRKLLYNLALLEYNDGSWRRSHPVIRTLQGYLLAQKSLTPTKTTEPLDPQP